MSKTTIIGCKIRPETKEDFENLCWKKHLRPSQLLRELIETELKRYAKKTEK